MVGARIDPARAICLTPGWGCPRHGTPARGALDDLQGSRIFLISSLFALHPPPNPPWVSIKMPARWTATKAAPSHNFPGPALSSGPRGPGQAYIVPFLEFFASESSSGCQRSSVHRGRPGEGKRAHHCPAGLQAAGMCRDAARTARPRAGLCAPTPASPAPP